MGKNVIAQNPDGTIEWDDIDTLVTPGGGTGDMLSTNNLNDVANKQTSRHNLDVNPAKFPSYVTTAANIWDAMRCLYNRNPTTRRAMVAALSKLVAGVSDFHMVAPGDSTWIGYNGATYNLDDAVPRQVGKAVCKMLGIPNAFTGGIQQFVAAGSTAIQSNCSKTGSFVIADNFVWTNAAAGTFTWVCLDAGTSVEFYASNLSTNGFTYSIDGEAPVAVTTNGTSSFKTVTRTGLSNKRHTVVFTSAAGQTVLLFGGRTWNPAIKQFHVHDIAIGGSHANNSGVANGKNWSSTASSPAGLGLTGPGMVTAAGVTPNLVLPCIGNNDAAGSVAANTIVTGLGNIEAYWPTAAFFWTHPPKVSGTSDTIFDDLSGQFFSFSDTNSDMYFSWDEWVGRLTGYTADGLAGADGIHPTQAHQWALGRHIAEALVDIMSPGLSGNVYRLVESGGVYPPRPSEQLVPAGFAEYVGADQPSDWLDGDTWDDLP
jgi:hypothetical protein